MAPHTALWHMQRKLFRSEHVDAETFPPAPATGAVARVTLARNSRTVCACEVYKDNPFKLLQQEWPPTRGF